MAAAAQKIYDNWDEEDYGGGGICDDIASTILGVIDHAIPGVEDMCISGDPAHGEQHIYVILYRGQEAYAVDIPPEVYETGASYHWTKTPNVQFEPNDVQIIPMDVDDAKGTIEYVGG